MIVSALGERTAFGLVVDLVVSNDATDGAGIEVLPAFTLGDAVTCLVTECPSLFTRTSGMVLLFMMSTVASECAVDQYWDDPLHDSADLLWRYYPVLLDDRQYGVEPVGSVLEHPRRKRLAGGHLFLFQQ